MAVWLTVVLWIVMGIGGIAVFWAALRTRKPVHHLLSSGLQGLLALGAVNLAGAFAHASLGVSWLTLGISGIFGIPGVIGLLLIKLILPA